MGLLQGPMTIRFYRVEGDVPKKYREDWLEEIKSNGFRELSETKEFGLGWVSPENFLDTDFQDQKVYANQYLTLALRIDKKAVDSRLFKALLAREVEKAKKAGNKEKLRPAEKKEIKDRLHRQLLAEAQPARRTYDLCWDVQAGRAYFFATGDKTQDFFRDSFQKTFHLEPIQMTVNARFTAAAGEEAPPDLDDPGREFLTWLFWRTDTEGGKFSLPKSGDVHLWVEDRMLFKDATEKPASAALTGGDPARSPEARASLFGGKRLSRVKLGLKRGEREWSFTLDGETLDLTGLKLPALLTEQEDEVLFERLALLEEAAFVVDELFGQWAKERLSDAWEKDQATAIGRWVTEGAPSGAVAAGRRSGSAGPWGSGGEAPGNSAGARKVAVAAPERRMSRTPARTTTRIRITGR